MFHFNNLHNPISSADQIQKLTIKNSKFFNIFYEIGSIVRLPERAGDASKQLPWQVEFTDSTFSNMSFCGSIISNDYPTFTGTVGHPIFEFNEGLKN